LIFNATILAFDGAVVIDCGEISGERAKPGEGSSLWRGSFSALHGDQARMKMGDTLYMLLGDYSRVGLVITDVVEDVVQFQSCRAGPPPLSDCEAAAEESKERR